MHIELRNGFIERRLGGNLQPSTTAFLWCEVDGRKADRASFVAVMHNNAEAGSGDRFVGLRVNADFCKQRLAEAGIGFHLSKPCGVRRGCKCGDECELNS